MADTDFRLKEEFTVIVKTEGETLPATSQFNSWAEAKPVFQEWDEKVGTGGVISAKVTRRSYQVLGQTVAIVSSGDRLK